MNNLIIDGTKTKPYVKFNSEDGILEIGGESYPENALEFYENIEKWLNEYLTEICENATNKGIIFNFRMVYFNTSSSKAILDILDILEKKYKLGCKIEVFWYHEEDDEDIEESGEEFADGLSLPYKIVSF